MEMHKTALERAFEIARSGRCINLPDVIKCLNQEGYRSGQIEGIQLRKQLLRLIADANGAKSGKPKG